MGLLGLGIDEEGPVHVLDEAVGQGRDFCRRSTTTRRSSREQEGRVDRAYSVLRGTGRDLRGCAVDEAVEQSFLRGVFSRVFSMSRRGRTPAAG